MFIIVATRFNESGEEEKEQVKTKEEINGNFMNIKLF